MLTKKEEKNAEVYDCILCDFKSSKKSNYLIHISTAKHKKHCSLTKNGYLPENSGKIMPTHICSICSKVYMSRVGLWYHTKKCSINDESIDNTNVDKTLLQTLIKENSDFKNIVLEVVKSNNSLQQQIIDLCKNNNTTINNSNINSNNKTFNLQVFLNEECKDAMNITDFMNSFVLQIKDLEKVGKLGYVDGITDIIVQKLKELDITQRPMHCSDSKRETLYVKDEGIWEKEGPTNNKVKKVVGHVSKHNLNLLNSWKDLHPCCLKSNSPHNDHYLHLVKESLGGPNDMDLTESKIVKKISKEIIIDKK
jgi:hypothetical protein